MKVRVFQLARELKISSDALVNLIQQFGAGDEVKSHMSAIEDDLVARVRSKVAEERHIVKQKFEKKPAPAEPPKPSLAPRPVPVTPAPVVAPPPPAPVAPAPVAPRPSPAPMPPQQAPHPRPTPPPAPRPAPSAPTYRMGPPVTQRPPGAPGAPGAGSRPGPNFGPGSSGGPRLSPPRVGPRDKKKKGGRSGPAATEETIKASVRRTIASLESGRSLGRGRRRRRDDDAAIEEESRLLRIHEFASVGELASVMEVKPAEVISTCLGLGILANINRRLDKDAIIAILDEFGFTAEFIQEVGEERLAEEEEEEATYEKRSRAPIVTVMGHVDHGKTSLLDYVRKTKVIEQESGGITQHIGAYLVRLPQGNIAFLDTPGHEAFTAMRARGAQVTDIVVLVVAADDRVQPQTIEAINHAKAANVPIIVAINKVDLPQANPDRIRKELADIGVLVEQWGGQTVSAEISAKHGQNVDKLLELILIVAELQDLKAEPDRPAKGAVIEARRDAGRGVVATILVQNGTLRVGDPFVCGAQFGKVRAMVDELGHRLKDAGPSTPVEVLGWSGVPMAGDAISVVKNESTARDVATMRSHIAREHEHRLSKQGTSLAALQERIKKGELKELNVVLKADVGGSIEALRDTLMKLSTDEVKVRIIHHGVGLINESDMLLAMASGAIVVGFHTRADAKAHQLALTHQIDIRLYRVIYDLAKDIKDAMAGLLAPDKVEKISGSAEVRRVFHVSKVGTIAGCYVVSGTIRRNDRARIYRGVDVVWDGKFASLKRIKDDAREVQTGFECGIGLEGYEDLKEGDVIEGYTVEEVARKLD